MAPRRSEAEALVLLAEHLRLVRWAVNRMARSRMPDEDPDDDHQDALIALWRCSRLYDEAGGTFANYAGRSLLRAIMRGRKRRRLGWVAGTTEVEPAGREREPWECLEADDGFVIPEHVETVRDVSPATVMKQEELMFA